MGIISSEYNNMNTIENFEYTNHLITEKSPYLRQHAHNPVDWYSWGAEAFQKARKENKPIFLSIGYSTCHWCHVMERESFTNLKTAEILNKNFVSIKVDKEELPDIDSVYMRYVVLLTGNGGWPLSIFLTHEKKPFYGGTYFPSSSQYGKQSFNEILFKISDVWEKESEKIIEYSDIMSGEIEKSFATNIDKMERPVSRSLLENSIKIIEATFDENWGGFESAPKFPRVANLELLMQNYYWNKDKNSLKIIKTTLNKMSEGGIYDQIGGGFHRYSTDNKWLVPHFEKMLYDNALLSKVYFNVYLLTNNEEYLKIGKEILDFVLSEMRDKSGGFYSAIDADSEGREGTYYIWSKKDIYDKLGEKRADIFCKYYGITETGNFDGKNIPHIAVSINQLSNEFKLSEASLKKQLEDDKQILANERRKRVYPDLDKKIIASLNGLMISSFALGYQVTAEEKYLAAAEKAASFIEDNLTKNSYLMHSSIDEESKIFGYLDDYVFVSLGYLDLYESTLDVKCLKKSQILTSLMIKKFWDENDGGFYYTDDKHSTPIVRVKSYYSGSLPSDNAYAAILLHKLSIYCNDVKYNEMAEKILMNSTSLIEKNPSAFVDMLNAIFFKLYPDTEIVISYKDNREDLTLLLDIIFHTYIPNKLIAAVNVATFDTLEDHNFNGSYMFTNKSMINDLPTSYVCRGLICKQPVTFPKELKELLAY